MQTGSRVFFSYLKENTLSSTSINEFESVLYKYFPSFISRKNVYLDTFMIFIYFASGSYVNSNW